jgi:hypothetical protein
MRRYWTKPLRPKGTQLKKTEIAQAGDLGLQGASGFE